MKFKFFSVITTLTIIASAVVPLPGNVYADNETSIHIIHTNDIHGYYKSTDYGQIGFDKLKSIIRAEDADIVLDVGDTFHGQSFATVESGAGIAEVMREIGYDAMTPGNHDWSYSASRLGELEKISGVPILASNIVTDDGEEYFDTPYLVKKVTADDGTKLTVGIVGVTDDEFYSWTRSENVEGLKFAEESAAAKAAAKALREKEKCDIVIAITHQHDCEGFVRGISGIDAVLAGHEHIVMNKTYNDADGKAVPVFEAGYYFYNVGCLELKYDKAKKTIIGAEDKIFTSENTADITADSAVSAKIAEIEERQKNVLNSVIGKSNKDYPYSWEEIRVNEQEIGRIITAAYLDATGADVAIENAGGIRAGISAGDITYGNLISISPYGNTLLTKELTGREILDILEYSLKVMLMSGEAYENQKSSIAAGMPESDVWDKYPFPAESGSVLQMCGIKAVYNKDNEAGNKVVSAKIGGEPLDESKTYTVAMNSYIADSTDYPSSVASKPVLTEFGTCEEALKAYIAKNTFESAAAEKNLIEYSSGAVALDDCEIKLEKDIYYYTGKEITPDVTLSYADIKVFKQDVDYKVTYSNNINTGTAEIIVESLNQSVLEGNSRKVTFTIKRHSSGGSSSSVIATAAPSSSSESTNIADNSETAQALPSDSSEIQLPQDVFADISNTDWYYDAVMRMYDYGYMNGVSQTEFSPEAPVTRGMFLAVIYRIEKEPQFIGEFEYKDVDAGEYYADAIGWASSKGIVLGYPDSSFRPDSEITREEAAVIIYRYCEFSGMNMNIEISNKDISAYDDGGEISEWAVQAMQWNSDTGIIIGKSASAVNPLDNVTRAETAQIIINMFNFAGAR